MYSDNTLCQLLIGFTKFWLGLTGAVLSQEENFIIAQEILIEPFD